MYVCKQYILALSKGFKQHGDDFIQFAASQKRGILWVLFLSLLLIFWIPICGLFKNEQTPPNILGADKTAIEQLFAQEEIINEEQEKLSNEKLVEEPENTSVFFPFDPNTSSASIFEKLGLNKGQIKSILKLRKKYNGFKRKVDFERLSVLDAAWIADAHNYILLPDSFEKKTFEKKEFLILDINTADSTQLETLPGIGKYMASKIVRYRERLGGYISADQMREITNMDIDIYNIAAPHICIKQGFKKININNASKPMMGNHPYIGWKAANNIINYRKQHNKFIDAFELSKAKLLSDSLVQKLTPYISF